jgi:Uma2 family endonuclease
VSVMLRRQATIDDLYQVEGKAELVRGQIVREPPTGLGPGLSSVAIFMSLRDHERRVGGGIAVPDNVAFVVDMPDRQSFSPDAAFYTGRWTGMKFADGAPVFAAEVRSEHDYGPAAEARMAAKRSDYFASGTLVVWDVDLLAEDVIRVYRAGAPHAATVYRRGEVADAEPAVPGWRMDVDALFE